MQYRVKLLLPQVISDLTLSLSLSVFTSLYEAPNVTLQRQLLHVNCFAELKAN